MHKKILKRKKTRIKKIRPLATVSAKRRKRIPRKSRKPLIFERLVALIRRHVKWFAVGALAVILIGIGLILAFCQPPEMKGNIDQKPEGYNKIDDTEIDDETLKGLIGEDESLFTENYELGELDEMQGIRIGVSIGLLETDMDISLMHMIEEAANESVENGEIEKCYFYNANGDLNQQIQDVRSMINSGVNAVVVGPTGLEAFLTVTALCESEGIPVAAYHAPVDQGYMVNVVTNQYKWGADNAQFMADNLPGGDIVLFNGKAESEINKSRVSGITETLKNHPEIHVAKQIEAGWSSKKAKQEMAALLENGLEAPPAADGGEIGGIIVQEGMAKGVLEAYIAKRTLPKVMCGDATAGFIKLWYMLKTDGIEIAPETDPDAPGPTDGGESSPTSAPEVFKAASDTFSVYALPSPCGAGATAFEFALRLAQGKTIKADAFLNRIYEYTANTVIHEDNLAEYYEKVKDQKDHNVINDWISDEEADRYFDDSAVSGQ